MQGLSQNVLAILGLGTPEIVIILFVILLLFGAKRLPELARGMGKSMREFRKAASEVEEEVRAAMDGKPEPVKKTAPEPQAQAAPPLPPVMPAAQPSTPAPDTQPAPSEQDAAKRA
jgi:sec-independent protein translocase protein TatA